MYNPPFYIFTPEMKQYRCLLLILLAQFNAFAQHPWGPAVPGPMPAGDIGYFEEETSVVWTIDLSSQGRSINLSVVISILIFLQSPSRDIKYSLSLLSSFL